MCNAHNHPADCECGFGPDTGFYEPPAPPSRTWRYRDEDLCHPTTCPICGAEVYFVRHNGGSVWFDELDRPWPKHGCFDDDPGTVGVQTQLVTEEAEVLGVVVKTVGADYAPTGTIEVRCSDGTFISETFKTSHLKLSTLPGELVIVRRGPDGKPTLKFLKPSS